MCGIGLVLLTRDESSSECAPAPTGSVPGALLHRRGPDSVRELTLHSTQEDGFELRLTGAVLHLRGEKVTPQPLSDTNGNVLLWNGEIFGSAYQEGIMVSPNENDTEKLLHALGNTKHSVMHIMNGVHGPWAFAYWDERSRTLWYGRDRLGRRSLLQAQLRLAGGWHALVLSSVSLPDHELSDLLAALDKQSGGSAQPTSSPSCIEWNELPADGLGCAQVDGSGAASFKWLQRQISHSGPSAALQCVHTQCDSESALLLASDARAGQAAAVGLLRALSEAVRLRVSGLPSMSISPATSRVGVLFSGGIDSMVLARLADLHLPLDEPIDLINVAFGDNASEAPDRISAEIGAQELAAISRRRFNLVYVDVSLDELQHHREQLTSLLHPARTVMDLNIGAALWFGARGRGRVYRPAPLTTPPSTKPDGCRYASRMPFPLSRHAGDKGAPDTCDAVYLHLDYEHAQLQVRIHFSPPPASPPLEHHCAISSSQRGESSCNELPSNEPACLRCAGPAYTSSARVLLLGMGADEQMGGYGRHRTVFRQEGWRGLALELQAERERLWLRNLGRDDRLVSDWGREARHPYLDESVMAFIAQTPLPLLCDLRREHGEGDKLILRRVARLLGLTYSSYLQKRAIQFGTRIANKNVCGMAVLDDSLDLADIVHPRADASCAPRSTNQDINKKKKAWGSARAFAPLSLQELGE